MTWTKFDFWMSRLILTAFLVGIALAAWLIVDSLGDRRFANASLGVLILAIATPSFGVLFVTHRAERRGSL